MFASRRQLRLVDVDIDLSWSDAGLRIVGENLYVDAPPGEPGGVRLNLLRTPAGYVVDVAGQSSPARHTLSELFQDAEMEITEAALERLRQRYLPLHAAAVARHGAGLLVIGAHDAGKTSLACALARSGAPLGSDCIPLSARSHPARRHAPNSGRAAAVSRVQVFWGIPLSATDQREHRPAARGSRMWPVVSPQSRGRTGCPVAKGRAGGVGTMSPRTVLRPGRCRRGAGHDCAARLARLPAARVSFDDAADAVEPVWRWFGVPAG